MNSEQFIKKIESFKKELPYTRGEYVKKTWGHDLHSLCSYQGKLKPAVAHWLVKMFSEEGDVVLDPLGGVGTVALEACLQGRKGISNDISILASTVAKAKISFPKIDDVMKELARLEEKNSNSILTEEDYLSAEFGLNASVKDYFHEDTLREILLFRKNLCLENNPSAERCYVAANLLHILHGNRPYALSRTSHALTPFAPKGEYIYKNVVGKITERLCKCAKFEFPENYVKGESYWESYENLNCEKANIIITSPPFVGMRFDRPNWMRLWLCGWNKEDFLETSKASLDRMQMSNWDVYYTFFQKCYSLLKEDAFMILHLGGSKKYDMVSELAVRSKDYFKIVDIVYEDVSNTEKHGVKDKGTTDKHIFVFMKKIRR